LVIIVRLSREGDDFLCHHRPKVVICQIEPFLDFDVQGSKSDRVIVARQDLICGPRDNELLRTEKFIVSLARKSCANPAVPKSPCVVTIWSPRPGQGVVDETLGFEIRRLSRG
jgi:hypothetical protein